MKVKSSCLVCGKTFENWISQGQKYCSKVCQYKRDNQTRFWTGKSHSEDTKAKISQSRTNKALAERNPRWSGGLKPVNCRQCDKLFYVINSRAIPGKAKFCSKRCAYKNASIQWGGNPDEKRRFVQKWWRELRAEVIKRDGDKCTRCEADKVLCVHHIIPYKICKNNDKENLVTLCRVCHMIVERQLSYA